MPRSASRLACIAAVAFLAGGCADRQPIRSHTTRDARYAAHATDDRPLVAHATSDAALARLGLLPSSELPGPVSRRHREPAKARCGATRLFRHVATSIATSPRFAVSEAEVQQTVALFRRPTAAARAFDRMSSPVIQRCLERYVRGQVHEQAHAAVGPVEERPLNVEVRGQQSRAYRLDVPILGGSFPITVAIDMLMNRIGRSLSVATVIWSAVPGSIDFQEALVARIASHLQQVLS